LGSSGSKVLVEYSRYSLLRACRNSEVRKEGPIANVVRESAALTGETNVRSEARWAD
jgi:hypothetical protein